MRRLLSILLLATFALPIAAPMLVLAQNSNAGLPACCRRHGEHHCTMSDTGRDNAAHRVVSVCPAWPQRAIPSPVGSHHFVRHSSSAAVSFCTGFSTPAQSVAAYLTATERLHPKRGPPTRLLA
jgi:hypothetical protein